MTQSTYASVFRPDRFAGRVHVVTGGGSGIGRCIDHELSALGAELLLVGRTLATLEAVQRELAAVGGKAHVEVIDIRDEAAVQRGIANVRHGLVNNTGGQFPRRSRASPSAAWATGSSRRGRGRLASRAVIMRRCTRFPTGASESLRSAPLD